MFSFKGKKWQKVNNEERRKYLLNAYRVLLTRARQGVVIVVPEGNEGDPTRAPEIYNSTYSYLRDIGIQTQKLSSFWLSSHGHLKKDN